MTSPAFEAVLGAPDDDASNLRLRELIVAREFGGPGHVMVAESYLRAFCNTGLSSTRRRWIGIALAGMIKISSHVVEHFRHLRHGLQGLGAIILGTTEREETKIVTGIIVRQAMEQGIEYSCFWASAKIMDSVPSFPIASGSKWMSKFQGFLDTLNDLALAQSSTDASIIYPVSIVASDGFRWRDSDDSLPIALIQAEMMTVIAADSNLRDIHFMDIPIEHIQSLRSQPSVMHDSQACVTGYGEPWDLLMTLRANTWTYRLDASKRTGGEVTLLFQHAGDAKEWECCINDRDRVSSSATHQEYQISLRAHRSSQRKSDMSSSDPIDASRSHSTWQHPRTEPPRLGQSGTSPSHHKENVQADLVGPEDATNEVTQLQLIQELKTAKQPPDQTKNKHTKTKRKGKEHAAGKRVEPSDESESINSDNMLSATDASEQEGSKQPASSKGKLPKISRATKQKVLQHACVSSDIFETLPEEGLSEREKRHADSDAPKTRSTKFVTLKQAGSLKSAVPKGGRSQTKRKADDDDDFVPDDKPNKRTNAKRKLGSRADVGKKRTKKARIEHSEDALTLTNESERLRIHAQSGSIKGVGNLQQQPERKFCENPPTSLTKLRHPLIGKLLSSQISSKSPIAQFKKPELPTQAAQTPSTPIQPKIQPRRQPARPQTPTNVKGCPRRYPLPNIASSPPLGNTIEIDTEWANHVTVDTEILSSNSKPVPASPNAESTAISGYADSEDMNIEKKKGEVQTARSDPFTRRREGQKATSFTRRLTGDEPATEKLQPRSQFVTAGITSSVRSDREELKVAASLQQRSPAQSNELKAPHSLLAHSLDSNLPAQVTGAHSPEAPAKMQQDMATDQVKQSIHSKRNNIVEAAKIPEKKKLLAPPQDSDSVDKDVDHDATSQVLIEGSLDQSITMIAVVEKYGSDVEMEDSVLTGAQHAIEETQTVLKVHACNDTEDDGDTTLVHSEQDDQPTHGLQAMPIHFRSSPPPDPGSPSSHSSTSAESEPKTDPPLPASEVEEMEWEASLRPHQRALHDTLIRTTKRVLRHIVDNETAVSDIADVFASDGKHVLTTLIRRHEDDYADVFEDMEVKKNDLHKELEAAGKQLAKERKRVRKLD